MLFHPLVSGLCSPSIPPTPYTHTHTYSLWERLIGFYKVEGFCLDSERACAGGFIHVQRDQIADGSCLQVPLTWRKKLPRICYGHMWEGAQDWELGRDDCVVLWCSFQRSGNNSLIQRGEEISCVFLSRPHWFFFFTSNGLWKGLSSYWKPQLSEPLQKGKKKNKRPMETHSKIQTLVWKKKITNLLNIDLNLQINFSSWSKI